MHSFNIIIYKGVTFSQNLSVTGLGGAAINLSGFVLSGFLKFKYSDTGRLTSLNPSGVQPYSDGIVNISVPATGTTLLPVGYGFYDIQLYGTGVSVSGTVMRGIAGKASIIPEATY